MPQFFGLCRSALALVAALSLGASHAQQLPKFLADRGAEFVSSKPGPGGTTAYQVRKDGKNLVVFVTPDNTTGIVGVLFDATTGENVSDPFITSASTSSSAPAAAAPTIGVTANAGPSVAQSTGSFASGHKPYNMQELQEHLREVVKASKDGQGLAKYLASSQVAGVVEGTGGPAQTTFVFVDPRCPYCHNLYRETRSLVRKGKTIKWIPVNTLGDEGLAISTALMYAGVKGLDGWAANTLPKREPSEAERSKISQNTVLFVMMTKQLGMTPGTPTSLFVNPASGKVAMVQGDGSNKEAFAAAFGK